MNLPATFDYTDNCVGNNTVGWDDIIDEIGNSLLIIDENGFAYTPLFGAAYYEKASLSDFVIPSHAVCHFDYDEWYSEYADNCSSFTVVSDDDGVRITGGIFDRYTCDEDSGYYFRFNYLDNSVKIYYHDGADGTDYTNDLVLVADYINKKDTISESTVVYRFADQSEELNYTSKIYLFAKDVYGKFADLDTYRAGNLSANGMTRLSVGSLITYAGYNGYSLVQGDFDSDYEYYISENNYILKLKKVIDCDPDEDFSTTKSYDNTKVLLLPENASTDDPIIQVREVDTINPNGIYYITRDDSVEYARLSDLVYFEDPGANDCYTDICGNVLGDDSFFIRNLLNPNKYYDINLFSYDVTDYYRTYTATIGNLPYPFSVSYTTEDISDSFHVYEPYIQYKNSGDSKYSVSADLLSLLGTNTSHSNGHCMSPAYDSYTLTYGNGGDYSVDPVSFSYKTVGSTYGDHVYNDYGVCIHCGEVDKSYNVAYGYYTKENLDQSFSFEDGKKYIFSGNYFDLEYHDDTVYILDDGYRAKISWDDYYADSEGYSIVSYIDDETCEVRHSYIVVNQQEYDSDSKYATYEEINRITNAQAIDYLDYHVQLLNNSWDSDGDISFDSSVIPYFSYDDVTSGSYQIEKSSVLSYTPNFNNIYLPKKFEFTCEEIETGKYIFKDASGKYLCGSPSSNNLYFGTREEATANPITVNVVNGVAHVQIGQTYLQHNIVYSKKASGGTFSPTTNIFKFYKSKQTNNITVYSREASQSTSTITYTGKSSLVYSIDPMDAKTWVEKLNKNIDNFVYNSQSASEEIEDSIYFYEYAAGDANPVGILIDCDESIDGVLDKTGSVISYNTDYFVPESNSAATYSISIGKKNNYLYTKETLDSSFEFEVGKRYVFGSSFYTVDYTNGAYSYTLDDGFTATITVEEFKENTDLYSKVKDNQDGTYVVRHHYIVVTKEEYDANPEYQAMKLVWTQNADIVDGVDYNFICLANSTDQFNVGYTITSDEIPDFSQESIWKKYKINKDAPKSYCPNFENIYLSEKYEFICEEKVEKGYIFRNRKGQYLCATPSRNSLYFGTYEEAKENPVYVETVGDNTYVRISDLYLMHYLVYPKNNANPVAPNTNVLRFYTSTSNKTNISVYSREESQTKNTITYTGSTDQVYSIEPVSYKIWVEEELGDPADYCFNSQGYTETVGNVITRYEYVADNADPVGIEMDCDESITGVYDVNEELVSSDTDVFVPDSNVSAEYTIMCNAAVLLPGKDFNAALKKLVNSEATYETSDTTVTGISFVEKTVVPNNAVRVDDGKYKEAYAWLDGSTVKIGSKVSTVYANADSSYMFADFRELESVDAEWFDISRVTDMSYMFAYAGYDASAFEVDISNWDMSAVTDMSDMFAYSGTNCIKENWRVTIPVKTGKLINNSTTLFGNAKTVYANPSEGKRFTLFSATLKTGKEINAIFHNLAGQNYIDVEYIESFLYDDFWLDSSITSIVFDKNAYDSRPLNAIQLDDNTTDCKVYVWLEADDTIKITSNTEYIYANEDSSYMFMGFNGSEEETFNIDLSWFDTTNVTDMSYMFAGTGLNIYESFSLDLSNFDTSNVIDMECMFMEVGENASSFTLDLSGFDTSKVTDMSYMFAYVGNSASEFSINLSNWNTSSVRNMKGMFDNMAGCIESFVLDLSKFDTSKVTDMSYMFNYAGNSASEFNIILSNWNTSNVINMSHMFSGLGHNAESLELNLSNWNVSIVTDMSNMFSYSGYNSTSFSLNLSNWNASSVTNMSNMFSYSGYNSTSFNLDLSDCDASNVTNVYNIFNKAGYNSTSFSLNLSGFKASNVSNMSYMFQNVGYNAKNSFSLNLSNFDTSNATSMDHMFDMTGSYANNFSLDLSSFDTSKVTDMSYMFNQAGIYSSSFSLDVSNFDTSNVTNMSHMFCLAGQQCSTLLFDVSNFDTSKVTDMSYMFSWVGFRIYSAFSLDLSDWDTSNVTNMSRMFEATGMYTYSFSLDLSNWDTSKVTDMSNMFSATGQYSTHYSLDLSSFDTSNVRNMSSMFSSSGKYSKTYSLDLSNFDTSSVTDMSSMFKSAGNTATSFYLNISNFDTSKVTNMSEMFQNAAQSAKTISLDLSNFNTSNVNMMNRMFEYFGYNAENFSLDLSDWDTSSVRYMENMFRYVGYNSKLFRLDLSDWDVSRVYSMHYIFEYTGYNSTSFTLDLSNWCLRATNSITNMFNNAGYMTNKENWYVIIPQMTGSLQNTIEKMYINSSKKYVSPCQGKEFTMFTDSENSILVGGAEFNARLKKLVNPDATYSTSDTTITSIRFGKDFEVPSEGKTNLSVDGTIPVYAWRDGTEIKITSNAEKIYLNSDSSYMFSNFYGTTGAEFTIDLSWFDSSRATSMSRMFSYTGHDASLLSIDFLSFDTSNVNNMSYMFYCAGYSASEFKLDLSHFNTSKVTDMYYLFNSTGYNAISYDLDLSSFDTSKVTNMAGMFFYAGYSASSFDLDLSNFNTSKVEYMFSMFSSAGYSATSFDLDLSNFDTSQVISMSDMFFHAGYSATSFDLDLSSFNTSSVSSMGRMFSYAGYSATSFDLDLSSFNTSYVTDMSYMFSYAGYSATSFALDLSNFNTSRVTNMSYMFSSAGYSATSFALDLSSFNTSKVVTMVSMFCSAGYSATSFDLDLSSFNTSNVTNMSCMFYLAGRNASTFDIDLSSFNTSNVTNMTYMFCSVGCNATSFALDLSNFNTSNVTNMSYMFSYTGYSASTFDIDLSSFDTSNVTNMSYMFYYAGHGVSTFKLDLSNFNTSKVEYMFGMFSYAGVNATSFDLNLFNWDMSSVNGITNMFFSAGHNSSKGNWIVTIPQKTSELQNSKEKLFGSTNSTYAYPGSGKEFTVLTDNTVSTLVNGKEFNARIKQLMNSTAKYGTSDSSITSILFSKDYEVPDEGTVVDLSIYGHIPVYAWLDGNTVKITSDAQTIYANVDSSYMFANFKGASNKEFKISTSWLDTSNVINMSYMFYRTGSYASLFELDLSKFNTSSVINMSSMFCCTGENSSSFSLDLSNFNTSNVTNMSWMFDGTGRNSATLLLNLSNLNTLNVVNMSGMFSGTGQNVHSFSLDLSSFNTSNVTDMSDMFGNAGYYSSSFSLDLSNFNTSNVEDMSCMFEGTGNSSKSLFINLSNFDMSKVVDIGGMFNRTGASCAKKNWKVVIPCKSENLINTPAKLYGSTMNVATYPYRDYGFTLPVSMLKSGKEINAILHNIAGHSDVTVDYVVTNAEDHEHEDSVVSSIIFDKDAYDNRPKNAVQLDDNSTEYKVYAWLEGEDTIKITSNTYSIFANKDSSYMFMGFNGAENKDFYADLSWFSTLYVTDMSHMLHALGANSYESFDVDISNWDTSNVTDMSYMFCSLGENTPSFSLNLSGFKTGNVIDMSCMFMHSGYNSVSYSLNVSGFNTRNATDMSEMFSNVGYSANVFELDLTRFNTENVVDMSYMFINAGNTSTSFSLDISGWDTSNVTDMSGMFSGVGSCSTESFSLDISGWDTSNVTDMSWMFYSFGSAMPSFSLDLSAWDTSNVTNMSYMFYNVGRLSETLSLNLSNWDTSNVTDMSGMFSNAGYSLESFSLDLSSFDTLRVTNMSDTFYYTGYDSESFSLDLSNMDVSNVTNMYRMFGDAGYKSESFSLDLSGWDTSSVTNMDYTFFNAGLSSDKNNWVVKIPQNASGLQNTAAKLYGSKSLIYASPCSDKEFTLVADTTEAELVNGKEVNSRLRNLVKSNVKYTASDLTIKSILFSSEYEIPDSGSVVNLSVGGTVPVYAWHDGDTIKIASEAEKIYANEDMSYMFAYFKGVSGEKLTINTSWFDTSRTTNMMHVFNCTGFNAEIFSLDLSNWDISNVTDMSYMFAYAAHDSDTFELNLAGLNTVNVKTMTNMFRNAGRNVSSFSLDLSTWDMSSVTDLSYMFHNAGSFASSFSLDLSGWDTSNITDMSYLFYNVGHGSLSFSLDLSDWNTSNVTDMSYMFDGAGYSAPSFSFNLSGWDTSNVTNMSHMFTKAGYNAASFSLDLSCFDTSNVTNMSYMFYDAGYNSKSFSLDLTCFDTHNVTNMAFMFMRAGLMSPSFTLNISNWDMSEVKDLYNMFYSAGGSSLKTNWKVTIPQKTSELQNTKSSLYGKLNTIVASPSSGKEFAVFADTVNSTLASGKEFNGRLKRLVDSKAVYTAYDSSISSIMFSKDYVVPEEGTIVDLSLEGSVPVYAWLDGDTVKVTTIAQKVFANADSSYMFAYFNGVADKELTFSLSWIDTSNVINMTNMFCNTGGNSEPFSLNLSRWYTSNVVNMTNMFYGCQNVATIFGSYRTVVDNVEYSQNMFEGCINLVGENGTVYNSEYTGLSYAQFDKENSPGYLTEVPVVYWSISSADDVSTLNISSNPIEGVDLEKYALFFVDEAPVWQSLKSADKNAVAEINIMNTVIPWTLSSWFKNFINITAIDFSNLDTSKATDMSEMFYYARGLKSLDLSGFNTANVTDMSDMFYFCNNLTLLDLSDFNTANVTDMSGMFSNCTSLKDLDIAGINTVNVTDMSHMFEKCSAFVSIDISDLDTENVTDMSGMFKDMANLTVLDLSEFNTAKVTDMSSMFENMYKLSIIFVDEETWNTDKVTSSAKMFLNDRELTGQKGTEYADKLTGDKTYALIDKTGQEGYLSLDSASICWAATESNKLYISSEALSGIKDEVISASGEFAPNADKPGWYNYSGKADVTEVIVKDRVSPFNMSYWFEGFSALDTVNNLSNINTVLTLNMSYLFSGCSSLSEINLRSFNTSKVTDMSYMFNSCTSLTAVAVSNTWITAGVTNSTSMLAGDTLLKGNRNTAYDAEHTDKEYARIDKGESRPGYFTSSLNGFMTGDTEYLTFNEAISAAVNGEATDVVITMINDCNESETFFTVGGEKNITIDLNGYHLAVKALNLMNPNALIIDSADDDMKGSLSYAIEDGLAYSKLLEKTDSADPTVRYLPVQISDNEYQFNDTTVGCANKTKTSVYWKDGDQAMIGSFIRIDNDIDTILSENGGVVLGIRMYIDDEEEAVTFKFKDDTKKEYRETYTHAKPYIHVQGVEGSTITFNGYVSQIADGIEYRIDGVSRKLDLVSVEN